MNFMKNMTYNLTNENVTLEAYILDSSREMPYMSPRPAVLVIPGGAYHMCSDREAEPIAMNFAAMGYHSFVLRYSLKEESYFPKPLNDAQEALDLIIENSEKWDLDASKIAVCGFSAGGHLAAALGTMGKVRPAGMILGYPCITKDVCDTDVLANRGHLPFIDEEVDEQTPPAFIFAACDDSCVPLTSSLAIASELEKRKIPFELHIFDKGQHGFATSDYVTCQNGGDADCGEWIPLCKSRLRNLFFD